MAKKHKKIVVCPVKPTPPGPNPGPKVGPTVEGGAVFTVLENGLDLVDEAVWTGVPVRIAGPAISCRRPLLESAPIQGAAGLG